MMCGASSSAGDGMRGRSWSIFQPLWPSWLFGKGSPSTVLGPFDCEPVKWMLLPSASALRNSSTR
jgi:hypothetical protein